MAIISLDNIADFIFENLRWIVIFTLSIFLTIYLLYLFVKTRLIRWAKNNSLVDIINDPKGFIVELVDILSKPELLTSPIYGEAAKSKVISAILWYIRNVTLQNTIQTTLLIGGAFFSVLASYLLFEQNRKIELQTQANIVSTILTEGARRASLYREGERLFDSIEKEVISIKENEDEECYKNEDRFCVNVVEITGTKKEFYRLSKGLSARLLNYSRSQTPYYLATSNVRENLNFGKELESQFTFKYLSPERGKLLQQLALFDVDPVGMYLADFSDSQLSYSQFVKARLNSLNLSGAELIDANLSYADLIGVNFRGANMVKANLRNADLRSANLINADLRAVDFSNADLKGAHLNGAKLRGARFNDANLSEAVFNGAELSGAFLTGANINGALFLNAEMIGTDLTGADLRSTNFAVGAISKPFSKALGLNRAKLPDGFSATYSKEGWIMIKQ